MTPGMPWWCPDVARGPRRRRSVDPLHGLAARRLKKLLKLAQPRGQAVLPLVADILCVLAKRLADLG